MRILIVDDHPLFQEALNSVIASVHPDWAITQAGSAEEAQFLITEANSNNTLSFDLSIVDLDLPEMQGDKFIEWLRLQNPRIPALIISAAYERVKVYNAIHSGALGFIEKTASQTQIILAIDTVMLGDNFISSEWQHDLNEIKSDTPKLSRRQQQVLSLMSEGNSNKEIGNSLFIAETTVKSHVQMLFEILDCSNRIECINKGHNLGFIESRES